MKSAAVNDRPIRPSVSRHNEHLGYDEGHRLAVANEEKILEKRVGYECPVQALAAIGAERNYLESDSAASSTGLP